MKPHFIAVLVFSVMILPGPLVATTIYVDASNTTGPWDGSPMNPYQYIQDGIDDAVSGVDTVIVRDGTYTGARNKDLDFGGKAITVMSENGALACTIDCQGSGRGFVFQSSETVASVVGGFTITNGHAGGAYPDGCGGGVYCDGSSPTIADCAIESNQAAYGGGMFCDHSSPTITNCTISGDSATLAGGGGIFCYYSSPAITNCTISDNTAAADGGGIYCTGSSPAISNCTISGNSAYSDGGGIYCFYCSNPTITNCTISGNTASDFGGGINCGFYSEPTITNCAISGNSAYSAYGKGGGIYCFDYTSPTIADCAIENNQADYGGGIYSTDSSPTITNCTISGNSTTFAGGGGIDCYYSSPTITNCTISGNTANAFGGGIDCYYSSPTITNCRISGNSARYEGGGIECSGSSPAITNCMISGNSARYGGGIECGESSPTITNCTISGNSADRKGGGIYCWCDCSPMMTNCILWANVAPTGHEIALTSTDYPSTLTVRYSDVQGGAGEAYVEAGCTLDLDASNIDLDPLFVSGPLHNYYLSQIAAGQGSDSPCVDAGSDTAANLGLDELTTRTDGVPDTGIVDMGYHAPYAPWIDSITRSGDSITIHWNARLGSSYVVEWSEDRQTWHEVNVGGVTEWTDVGALASTKKFYRVREVESTSAPPHAPNAGPGANADVRGTGPKPDARGFGPGNVHYGLGNVRWK